MNQQITPLLRLLDLIKKSGRKAGGCFTATTLLWLAGLNVAPAAPTHADAACLPGDTTITATICANETYLFNGEQLYSEGEYTATFTASDGTDSVVTLQLSVLPIALKTLTASICQGETYLFNGQALTQPGEYELGLTAENGCDSIVTLQLTVLPNPLTNLAAAICEGAFYIFQGDTLTESGNYSIVLPAANGCDSIVRLKLDVVTSFDTQIKAAICQGETYLFGGNALGMGGIYVDSLTASGGCDSVVTLTLKILPVPATHFSAAICEGAGYVFQGGILTESGIYIEKYTAANGCDSLVLLDLSVVPFFDVALEVSVCDGEKYVFGNDTLGAAGVYVDSLSAAGGCDSIVTLTLTVLPVPHGALEATICEGDTFEYNGEPLTQAGVYEFALTGENGCDSIVAVTLNVLPVSSTSLEASICQGETYDFNGESLTEAGTYTQVLDAENGCDSTVTLQLTVLPVQHTDIEAAICAGESYEFNGDTLTATGEYQFAFAGENGCDSVVTLLLNVLPVLDLTVNVAICTGESYEFNDESLTDAGTYSATFTGPNGCDSTVTLILDVLPVQNTALSATICDGSVYEFNGDALSDAGTYTAVLAGENGCDSTVTLTLTVLPTQNTSLDATICEGESYNYNGETLTDAGVYAFVFEGENGCDSTVALTVTVLPVAQTMIETSICDGGAYEYDGDTLTESGSYEFVFGGQNGCDSIVTVQLTVLPLSGSSLSVAQCEGTFYQFNGDTLTISGTYTAVLTAANGCDSTVTLQLAFVSFFETALEASICPGESYQFGNDTLTESGDYSLTLSAVGGCDSILTLTLTVLPLTESTTDASICAGGSYEFNGEMLTESGTYTATLTGTNGCDSTALLHLTVLPTINTSLDATICSNETYNFNGETLTDAGTYTAVLTAENGCDSTVTLDLAVIPIQSSSFAVTICAGDSYTYNGQTLTIAGTYGFSFDASNGCDSLVTLHLNVLPLAEGAFAVVNCNGESYEYEGQVLNASGTYQFAFPGAGANGCDSIVTLYLTIFPAIPPTNISASICAGEIYNFYGIPVAAGGTYTADLASATGCDSTVVLHLTVLPVAHTVVNAAICEGEGYQFNGETIFAPGNYTAALVASNGCDSIVNLNLTVKTVNATITLQDGTLTAQATNATFQWIDCANNQPIAGASGSSFTPTVTGEYAVIVTQNGCSNTSGCILVQVVSTFAPLDETAWAIRPNPARSHTTVVLKEAISEETWIEMHDSAGKLLSRQKVAFGAVQIELDLSSLPDGLLLLRLVNVRGASTKRFVKAEH